MPYLGPPEVLNAKMAQLVPIDHTVDKKTRDETAKKAMWGIVVITGVLAAIVAGALWAVCVFASCSI